MERKLAAILCADVFGYSRLMGDDEEATLRTLTSHRKLIDSAIEQHHGRFVNSAGDSVLAEFAGVVEAVNCAVEIQTGLKAENESLAPERRMEFRIGVNLGDVMVQGDQILGDGVNVAARLESLAEPGGISLSGIVHEQVRDKLALIYEDQGEQAVKNIARPVHMWRVLLDGATPAPGKNLPSHADPERDVVAQIAQILRILSARDFPMSDPMRSEACRLVGRSVQGRTFALLSATKSAESASHLAASERRVLRTAGTPKSRPEKENRDEHRN